MAVTNKKTVLKISQTGTSELTITELYDQLDYNYASSYIKTGKYTIESSGSLANCVVTPPTPFEVNGKLIVIETELDVVNDQIFVYSKEVGESVVGQLASSLKNDLITDQIITINQYTPA